MADRSNGKGQVSEGLVGEGDFTATFKLKVSGYGRDKDVEWLRQHLSDQCSALLHRPVVVSLKKVVR